MMKSPAVLLMSCATLMLSVAAARSATAQVAADQPAAAEREITVKGIILSTWHYYQHEMPRNQSPRGTREKFDLVLYAFDGPPSVKATLDRMMAKYFPADGGGMDAESAIALQKEFDDRLRYYVDTGDEKTQARLVWDHTWVVAPASVTGTLVEKDGKRRLTGARVEIEKYRAKINSLDAEPLTSFEYPPRAMLKPDKPLVMPREKPIELEVAGDLKLRCVPIPPGRFIMGSPFYQCPRYQDECPVDVTLTKTFYFSEIPVTQEMFDRVCGAERNRSVYRGPQLAVENTPFPDIREFCRILSEKNGRKVRVPTAAELEYVARLGNSSPCFPAKYFPMRTRAGARENPSPVRTGKPNAWGVYDLPASAITAVSDWKAPNRPGKVTDPQGEPLGSPWVYYDSAIRSVQKVTRPVEGMILKPPHNYPAVHKGGSGLDWDRPNQHDRYAEDGLDGGNGRSWIGIFRVVVEAKPEELAAAAGTPARNLADEPEWWTRKVDYVKTWEKLQQDYQNLPDYTEAMKKVHTRFTGRPGTLAMFGASQTGAREFWSPLADRTVQKNVPPEMQRDYDLVNSYMKPECWKWKGARYGNTGGMSTKWVNETACGEVLKRLNPEVVVILIGQGTMDRMLRPPHVEQFEEWKRTLTEACEKCLANGSIVILSTFPPRASRRADVFNEAILQIAAELELPVTDWGGECIKRSPTGWNGADPEVRAKYNYVPDPRNRDAVLNVPTLISFDGQHASYPLRYANDWSEESLRSSGNNLRTYITLTVYADVLRKVLGVEQPPTAPAAPAEAKPEFKGPEQKYGMETWVVTSDYQETPCKLFVLLPDRLDRTKRYKVLYVLPCLGGDGGDPRDGMTEARKLDLADKYNLICVGPGFSRMPWYADLPDNPKVRYDSYLPEVIVPFVDRTYPTVAKPEGRLLVGFSKSGLGAVTLLVRHPDVFGRAGSWDAPLMETHTRPEFFGPQEYFLANYCLPDLLRKHARTLANGPARIAITGHGWRSTKQAHELMTQLAIPHHFDDSIRPAHEWKSGWLRPLVEVLMSDDMTKARPVLAPPNETK